MNITQIPQAFWEGILRFIAKKKLIWRYEYMIQMSMLMEEFDMDRILNYQEEVRNKDLNRVQEEIKAMAVMIDFLKHINKKKK